jgi:hypothetical protein
MSSPDSSLRVTPLHDRHRTAGAKVIDSSGVAWVSDIGVAIEDLL